VRLAGVSDDVFTSQALESFVRYREDEALRLCLKHFRQRNYMDVFSALQNVRVKLFRLCILT